MIGLLAYPLFGVATLRAGVLPKLVGWLQIASVLVGVIPDIADPRRRAVQHPRPAAAHRLPVLPVGHCLCPRRLCSVEAHQRGGRRPPSKGTMYSAAPAAARLAGR